MLFPRDEIMDLLDLHAAVEPELLVELGVRLRHRGSPDLGCDDRLGASRAERPGQHLLGAAIHGRAVEEPGARLPGHVHDLPSAGLALGPDVEGPPGAEPDHGYLPPRPPEAATLHHAAIMVRLASVAAAGEDTPLLA